MTGDTVMARVVQRGKRDGQMRYSGEIIQILERGPKSDLSEHFCTKTASGLLSPTAPAAAESYHSR